MIGLFSYFYVVLHFLAYSWFDMGFDFAEIAKDIAKRPFILVGFAAFVLLTPLAATSFNRAVKAMGLKRWQALHRLIYVIAGLGILHFFWMRAGKHNFAEVSVYAAILAVLLGWRVVQAVKKRLWRRQARGAVQGRRLLSSSRSWSAGVSRSRMTCAFAPSTSTSTGRPRVL